jgi:hypothetical protein
MNSKLTLTRSPGTHLGSNRPALVDMFGLPSAAIGLDLLINRTTEGRIPVIGLFLAWIGGTLLWGLASLLHHPLLSTKGNAPTATA